MRKRKLTEDAFAYFVSLGSARRYKDVADHFKVSLRTVVTASKRENWPERLAKIERDAQANADLKLQETVEAMRLRHSKMLRAMATRAAKALQEYPLSTGMEGMKAAEMVIKLERLLAGEPTERTAMDIEKQIREEHERLLVPVEEAPKAKP
jgi:stress response protein YsnF